MLVSIIIPCKDEKANISGLLKDISSQKVSFDTEVIKITNVNPPGKARNTGAKKAKGDIFVFIDCDIRLSNESVLTNLIKPLLEDKTIGTVTSSIRIPPNASKFQVRYAKEVPHSEYPIVDKVRDIGLATTQCWAIFSDIFLKLGGFNKDIIRGEDSELSFRLKKAGYRIVLAPHTWCYHPLPDNIIQLIKTQFRNGVGVAFVDVLYPTLNIDIHPDGILYFSEKKSIFERAIRFLRDLFQAIFKMKILLLLAKIFYVLGYFYGVFKYRILKYKVSRYL